MGPRSSIEEESAGPGPTSMWVPGVREGGAVRVGPTDTPHPPSVPPPAAYHIILLSLSDCPPLPRPSPSVKQNKPILFSYFLFYNLFIYFLYFYNSYAMLC